MSWRVLLLALALGMIARVVVFEALQYSFDTGDAVTYQGVGRNLALHGAYSLDYSPPFTPTVLRAPLLPFLFSLTLRVFGDSYIAFQLVQAVLDLGACSLLYLALRRYAPVAAMAFLCLALFLPFNPAFAGALLSESLCGSLLAAAISVPLLAPSRWVWFVSGVLTGAAALTKDIYLGLMLVVPILLLLGWAPSDSAHREPAYRRRNALLFVAAAIVVVAPWTWRNHQVRHQFIPVSAGLAGQNLFNGTWERHYTTALDPGYVQQAYGSFDDRAQAEAAGDVQDELSRDRAYARVAWRRIRAHPFRVVGNWLVRPWQMWLGNRLPFPLRFAGEQTPSWFAVKISLALINAIVVAFAAAGLWMAVRQRLALLWLAVPIVYTAVAYLPFHNSEVRYSQPVFMLLLVFAAMALMRLRPAEHGEARPA